jgi:dienelactone hydrolase
VHAFDNVETPPMTYLGHRLGYDPQAAADSFGRTQAYFGRYLKGEAAR